MVYVYISVVLGNFVIVWLVGIFDGVDFVYIGIVCKIDVELICYLFVSCKFVLLLLFGFLLIGEVFNLLMEDVVLVVVIVLCVDKIIFLIDGFGIVDDEGELVCEMLFDVVVELFDFGNI